MLTLRLSRTADDKIDDDQWDTVVNLAVEMAETQIPLPFDITITTSTTTKTTVRAELSRVEKNKFEETGEPGLALRLVADWGVAYVPIRNITSIEIDF